MRLAGIVAVALGSGACAGSIRAWPQDPLPVTFLGQEEPTPTVRGPASPFDSSSQPGEPEYYTLDPRPTR